MAEDIIIDIGADIGDADRELGKLNKEVGKLDKQMGRADKSGKGLFGSIKNLIKPTDILIGAVGGLGFALGSSVGKAASFDEKMAAIRATSNATDSELAALRKTALDLGMATDVGSVSADDAADAIFELGKAGISTDAITKGVAKSVLQLAAAAGPEFGVANAASLAADALSTFNLEASDSTKVVNTLVGASNASSIGLSELKFSMSAAGAVANALGLSIEDTATAFAVFGANGVKGSDAGTSFKAMLLNLNPTTNAAKHVMSELGLWTAGAGSAFFDAAGHVKTLDQIAGILKDSLSGLTDQQRLQALETMFGSDAIRVASILYSEGAEGVKTMTGQIEKQGDAAKVAADMTNNLRGKWEAFTGTVETIQIVLGTKFIPTLNKVVDKANELGGAFLHMLDDPKITGSWEALGTTIFNAVTTIIGPKLLLAGIHLAPKLWEWITNEGPKTVAAIKEWGEGIWKWIETDGLHKLEDLIKEWGPKLTSFVEEAKTQIVAKLNEWGDLIFSWLRNVALPKITEEATKLKDKLINWIADATRELPGKLDQFRRMLNNWFAANNPSMQQSEIEAFMGVNIGINQMGRGFDQAVLDSDAFFAAFKERLHNFLVGILGALTGSTQPIADGMGSGFVRAVIAIPATMLNFKDKVIDGLQNVLSSVIKGLVDIYMEFKRFFDQIPVLAVMKLQELQTAIIAELGRMVSQVFGKGKDVGSSIVDGIAAGISAAWGRVQALIQQLINSIPQEVRDLLGIGRSANAPIDVGGDAPAQIPPRTPQVAATRGLAPVHMPPHAPRFIAAANGGGGQRPIVINLDGREIARVLADRIEGRNG